MLELRQLRNKQLGFDLSRAYLGFSIVLFLKKPSKPKIEIISEILGPTFDKENSDNVAGELTIDLLYAIVYYPLIGIETALPWSNDLNSKYRKAY